MWKILQKTLSLEKLKRLNQSKHNDERSGDKRISLLSPFLKKYIVKNILVLFYKEDKEMAITEKMVKELREKTGVGMMDCKKALKETDGDMDKAVDYLREKGMATAAKKAGRIAAEGSTFIATDNNTAVLLEVNCETDFVTKNEQFKQL